MDDDPKKLDVAMEDAKRFGCLDKLDFIKLKFGRQQLEAQDEGSNWKMSLLTMGCVKNIEHALKTGLVSPNSKMNSTPNGDIFGYTFKYCCWLPNENDITYIWIDAARNNADEWKANTSALRVVSDGSGLSWLKEMFITSFVFMDDVMLNVKDNSFLKVSKTARRVVELKPDGEEMSMWDLNSDGVTKSVVDLKHETNRAFMRPGPSAAAYKSFVSLGWCSLEDVEIFNRWVLMKCGEKAHSEANWHRKELVSWVESEKLKRDIGSKAVLSVKKLEAL